jgi:epoxyqueuosine reductase
MGSLVEKIRRFARGIGFDLVGFTPADSLPQDEQALLAWLSSGYAGEMSYMARDPSRRSNPKQILPEAKTIICLALNYYPGDHPYEGESEPLALPGRACLPDRRARGVGASEHPQFVLAHGPPHINGRISRYAWGTDYHQVIEEKLDLLEAFLRDEVNPSLKIKRYVDYGPILERAYASRAGLGFIGKNTMLITHEWGSWVFLAQLITDLELEYDQKLSNPHRPFSQCGSCTLCIDACPTGAIIAPFTLDARRCISYLTIENKGEIPTPVQAQIGDWVFGCDICQEVCPYNQQAQVTQNSFVRKGAGPWLDIGAILDLTEETFKSRFQHTPLLRPKHRGIQRNAKAVARNSVTVMSESGRTPV